MPDKTPLHEPIAISGVRDDIEIDFAMQYVDSYTDNIYSFVNNSENRGWRNSWK